MLSEPEECLYCLGGLLHTSVMCLIVMHASFRYIAQFACLPEVMKQKKLSLPL